MQPSDHAAGPRRTDPESARLVLRLRGLRPTLSPAEDRVAAQVLADPRAAAGRTIGELAAAARTSETTVLRFCRRLGLAGYPQLRLALAEEGAPARERRVAASDIGPDDTTDDVVAKLAAAGAVAIEETAEQLDRAVLDTVAQRLAGARRVELYGHGASALVAADLQQKLRRIGRVVTATSDPHLALAGASILGPRDVAIGFSHSGQTQETIEAVSIARRGGACTVAVTNHPRSPLARAAEFVLTTSAHETVQRAGATASRIAALLLVDCLYLAVAHRDVHAARQAVATTREAVASHRVRDETR